MKKSEVMQIVAGVVGVLLFTIGIGFASSRILGAAIGDAQDSNDMVAQALSESYELLQTHIENENELRASLEEANARIQSLEADGSGEADSRVYVIVTIDENGNTHVVSAVDDNGKSVDTDTISDDIVEQAISDLESDDSQSDTVENDTINMSLEAERLEKIEKYCTLDDDGQYVYIVRRGDTMSGIAGKLGFTVAELAEYNSIRNVSKISVRQVIKLPIEIK